MKIILWISCIVSLFFAGFSGITALSIMGVAGFIAASYNYLMWAVVMGLFAMHHDKHV